MLKSIFSAKVKKLDPTNLSKLFQINLEKEEILEECSCSISLCNLGDINNLTGELICWNHLLTFCSSKSITKESLIKLNYSDILQIDRISTNPSSSIQVTCKTIYFGDDEVQSNQGKEIKLIISGTKNLDELFDIICYLWNRTFEIQVNIPSIVQITLLKHPKAFSAFRKLFPDVEEDLVGYFTCSVKVQVGQRPGFLFITSNGLFIYTSFFLSELKFRLNFQKICWIEKSQIRVIIPSIDIIYDQKKLERYTLTSFVDRDKTELVLNKYWIKWISENNNLQYSPFQIEHLLEQFRSLGTGEHSDGTIHRKEFIDNLGAIILSAGLGDALFNIFDLNQNNFITFTEFLLGMNSLFNDNIKSKLEFSFKLIDKNKDGLISKMDLTVIHEIVKTIAGVAIDLPSNYILANFETLDQDKDGKINLEEYCNACLDNIKIVEMITLGSEGGDEIKKGTKLITFGNSSWKLLQNLLLAIQTMASNSDSFPSNYKLVDHFPEEWFTAEHEIKLPNYVNENWIVNILAPNAFQFLRDLFGYSKEIYLSCMGPQTLLKHILTGNLNSFVQLSSSGRSGSVLLQSQDKKIMIKTLPPVEAKLLLLILPKYIQHIRDNPNTLLTKFLGLYQIRHKETNLTQYLIVMLNIFNTSQVIHELYDLKGSTIDRSVKEEDRRPGIALKDNDLKRRICIDPELRHLLLEQANLDTQFLLAHNICDYSLLVGFSFQDKVHTLSKNENEEKNCKFQSYFGGIKSCSENVIYFLGIIDILTPYDFRKVSENKVKTIIHITQLDAKDQISAVPPLQYQKRFLNYLSKIIVSK